MKRYIRATSIYTDDLTKRQLISELNSLKDELTQGDEFYYETRNGICVSIFWDDASPVIEVIDNSDNVVFSHSAENNSIAIATLFDDAIAKIREL
jgi:hypothetical protein